MRVHGAPAHQQCCRSGILCLPRFWHQLGGRLQCGAHQDWASFQRWQLGTLLSRQQCDSLVQQVTDSGSKGYWCLAGNWVYLCRRGHPRLLVFPFLVVMNHGVRTNRQLHRLHPHKRFTKVTPSGRIFTKCNRVQKTSSFQVNLKLKPNPNCNLMLTPKPNLT